MNAIEREKIIDKQTDIRLSQIEKTLRVIDGSISELAEMISTLDSAVCELAEMVSVIVEGGN